MNSPFNPIPNYYQFNTLYPNQPVYEYGYEYSCRADEQKFNENIKPSVEMQGPPQIKIQKAEEIKEVHKEDFVTGFVPKHNHGLVDYTSVDDGHVHLCLDVTSPPKQLKDGTHIHYTEGYTLFEDGHHHYYKAWSSPAIPVGKGMHVHYYEFDTMVEDGHKHHIKGLDMPSPGTL